MKYTGRGTTYLYLNQLQSAVSDGALGHSTPYEPLFMGKLNDAKVLNTPLPTKLLIRERPVGNHLGFYALPEAVKTSTSK